MCSPLVLTSRSTNQPRGASCDDGSWGDDGMHQDVQYELPTPRQPPPPPAQTRLARLACCTTRRPRPLSHNLKRRDTQAACEPGRGGCAGVPVHPARLHTHRTSPAQALVTILAGHAQRDGTTQRAELSRTATVLCVGCPVCTSGALRTERGWVTALNGGPQSGLGGTSVD
jgi:hypothetical protein